MFKIKIISLLSISLLMIYIIAPCFWKCDGPFFLSTRIPLGLDLEGGIHVILRADFEQYINDEIKESVAMIREELRKNKINPRKINIRNGVIHVYPPISGENRLKKLEQILKQYLSSTQFDFSSSNDGHILISYTKAHSDFLLHQVVHNSVLTLQKRIDSLGTRDTVIQPYGSDSILVQIPGINDYKQFASILGKTAKLKFVLVGSSDQQQSLGGNLLIKANISYDQFGNPVVAFKFNGEGTKKFAEITTKNVGKKLAIVLDHKTLAMPVIKEPILTGTGEINGKFSFQEAHDLATLLTSGALPAPLKIVEERVIDASLGRDSIVAGKKAAIAAFGLVSLFMLLIYKVAGLWTLLSLVFNLMMIFVFIILARITLTFPGLAGIILTIGMSVDANVLIFERIKENMASGKKRLESIESGFHSAFGTILDANITTLITAVSTFLISSSPIKGFAMMLSVGIFSSLVSTLMVTKFLMRASWKIKRLL